MQTGNQELIRDINTESVIRTILQEGPVSRAGVASSLGLTKATVSAIVQTLIDRDLVLELETTDIDPGGSYPEVSHTSSQKKKGRRPILLQLNKNCGYIISIELTDQINIMLSDLIGKDTVIHTFPLPEGNQSFVPCLIAIVEQTLSALPVTPYGLLGIALGIHGVVHHNQIMFLPHGNYQDTNLADALQEHFQVPVLMENEANLAALAEWINCHPTNEMVYISVHTGIGAGIIMRNQLQKGKHGYAGELGHTVIQIDGRPCACGNHGCLEQYASVDAICRELSERKGYLVDAERFGLLFHSGDLDAQRLMDEFTKYMAIAINNLLNTYNPDIVVLNSVFNRIHPALCEDIMQKLHNRMRQYCHLIPAALEDHAVLLGGAYLVHKQFLYPNTI